MAGAKGAWNPSAPPWPNDRVVMWRRSSWPPRCAASPAARRAPSPYVYQIKPPLAPCRLLAASPVRDTYAHAPPATRHTSSLPGIESLSSPLLSSRARAGGAPLPSPSRTRAADDSRPPLRATSPTSPAQGLASAPRPRSRAAAATGSGRLPHPCYPSTLLLPCPPCISPPPPHSGGARLFSTARVQKEVQG